LRQAKCGLSGRQQSNQRKEEMKAIYSVLIKDVPREFGSLIQHTMFFDNPPTGADISAVLLNFINPGKRLVSAYIEDRVKAWSHRILGGVTYYASDLKYRAAVWNYNTGAEEKAPFSLTISVVDLNECAPEKEG